MNHEPFETWILSQKEENLTPQQQTDLQEHLEDCPICQQLDTSWANVENLLICSPMVSAPLGFTQRAQDGLVKRRQREHQLQIRRFFLFTFVFLAVTSLALTAGMILFLSPLEILVNAMHIFARCALFLQQVENVMRIAVTILPPIIPLALITAIFGTFTILSFVWSLAMMRISVKGVL